MFFALLTLPALVVGLSNIGVRQDDAQHLLLARRMLHRRGGVVDLERIAISLDSLRSKYGQKAPRSTVLDRRTSETTFDIIGQGSDTTYLVSIEVGTPAQTLDVQLDTGSSILWFVTTECANCSSGTPEFNITDSSTLNASSESLPTLSYGSGNASGTVFQDNVALGQYTVVNQTFVGVTEFTPGLINGSTVGILGLSFQGQNSSIPTPFWQALIDAGELKKPEMSSHFTRFKDVVPVTSTTELHPGGTFTLGGTNSSFYKGVIEFLPFPNVTQPSFWLQTVTGFTVDGDHLDIGNATENLAAIDTGTQYIGGPTKAVQAFWARINGSQALSGDLHGLYQFPCTMNITSTLSFGGRAWPIFEDDMNLGPNPDAPGFCVGAVFDVQQTLANPNLPDLPNWLIGDTFLKNVYSVFKAGDNPAVGFAELADDLDN